MNHDQEANKPETAEPAEPVAAADTRRPQFQGMAMRLRRVYLNLTYEDLRTAMRETWNWSVAISTLNRWELGHAKPTNEDRRVLADLLFCDPEDFGHEPVFVSWRTLRQDTLLLAATGELAVHQTT